MAIPQYPVSFNGTKFVCGFEKFEPKPYKDPGGDGHWVIGYGTEIPDSDYPKYASGITEADGLFLFSKYATNLQKQLAKTPLVTLDLQCQKDAVFSLAYNMGFQKFIDAPIYIRLIHREPDLSSWLEYCHGENGKVLAGLQRRRRCELRLFIHGIYDTD